MELIAKVSWGDSITCIPQTGTQGYQIKKGKEQINKPGSNKNM